MHCVVCALLLARDSTGSSSAAKIAMMAITTNNSISVNPSLDDLMDYIIKHRQPSYKNFPASPTVSLLQRRLQLRQEQLQFLMVAFHARHGVLQVRQQRSIFLGDFVLQNSQLFEYLAKFVALGKPCRLRIQLLHHF